MDSLNSFAIAMAYLFAAVCVVRGVLMILGRLRPLSAFGDTPIGIKRARVTGAALILGQLVVLASLASTPSPLVLFLVLIGSIVFADAVGWLFGRRSGPPAGP
jgi:hypothetical protein